MMDAVYKVCFDISCYYACASFFLLYFFDIKTHPLLFVGILVAAIFWSLKINKKRTHISYLRFTDLFKRLLCIITPLIFIAMFWDGKKGLEALSHIIPYLIVFLVSGVFLQQILRYEDEVGDRSSFERYQRRQAFAFFIFCFLLTV